MRIIKALVLSLCLWSSLVFLVLSSDDLLPFLLRSLNILCYSPFVFLSCNDFVFCRLCYWVSDYNAGLYLAGCSGGWTRLTASSRRPTPWPARPPAVRPGRSSREWWQATSSIIEFWWRRIHSCVGWCTACSGKLSAIFGAKCRRIYQIMVFLFSLSAGP